MIFPSRILLSFFLIFLIGLQAEAQWTTQAPMPGARWAHVCAPANGRMYVLAGSTAPTYEYDPGTNSWAVRASIPTARSYPAVAVWNNMIYVLGGSVGAAWSNLNERYDPATNTWTTLAPMPTVRTTTAAAAVNGRIYVMNGWNGSAMSAVDVYDIATNTWSSGVAAPTARSHAKTAVVNNRIYLVGGYNGGWLGTNEEFDPATNTWATRAAMPTGRYIHAVGGGGTQVLAAGGYTGSASNSFQSYDVTTNTWTTLANLPTARYRVDGAVLNGCFYVLGGYNGSNLNVNEVYCGIALPLEIELRGKVEEKSILLTWEDWAGELSGQFTIERKGENGPFEPIGRMVGGGRTGGNYLFSDPDPFPGENLYRLRLENPNGEVHFSNSLSLRFSPLGNVAFAYLGETEEMILDWSEMGLKLPFEMEIYSPEGRKLMGQRLDPAAFPEGKMRQHLRLPEAGIYLLSLQSSEISLRRKVLSWGN